MKFLLVITLINILNLLFIAIIFYFGKNFGDPIDYVINFTKYIVAETIYKTLLKFAFMIFFICILSLISIPTLIFVFLFIFLFNKLYQFYVSYFNYSEIYLIFEISIVLAIFIYIKSF